MAMHVQQQNQLSQLQFKRQPQQAGQKTKTAENKQAAESVFQQQNAQKAQVQQKVQNSNIHNQQFATNTTTTQHVAQQLGASGGKSAGGAKNTSEKGGIHDRDKDSGSSKFSLGDIDFDNLGSMSKTDLQKLKDQLQQAQKKTQNPSVKTSLNKKLEKVEKQIQESNEEGNQVQTESGSSTSSSSSVSTSNSNSSTDALANATINNANDIKAQNSGKASEAYATGAKALRTGNDSLSKSDKMQSTAQDLSSQLAKNNEKMSSLADKQKASQAKAQKMSKKAKKLAKQMKSKHLSESKRMSAAKKLKKYSKQLKVLDRNAGSISGQMSSLRAKGDSYVRSAQSGMSVGGTITTSSGPASLFNQNKNDINGDEQKLQGLKMAGAIVATVGELTETVGTAIDKSGDAMYKRGTQMVQSAGNNAAGAAQKFIGEGLQFSGKTIQHTGQMVTGVGKGVSMVGYGIEAGVAFANGQTAEGLSFLNKACMKGASAVMSFKAAHNTSNQIKEMTQGADTTALKDIAKVSKDVDKLVKEQGMTTDQALHQALEAKYGKDNYGVEQTFTDPGGNEVGTGNYSYSGVKLRDNPAYDPAKFEANAKNYDKVMETINKAGEAANTSIQQMDKYGVFGQGNNNSSNGRGVTNPIINNQPVITQQPQDDSNLPTTSTAGVGRGSKPKQKPKVPVEA